MIEDYTIDGLMTISLIVGWLLGLILGYMIGNSGRKQ